VPDPAMLPPYPPEDDYPYYPTLLRERAEAWLLDAEHSMAADPARAQACVAVAHAWLDLIPVYDKKEDLLAKSVDRLADVVREVGYELTRDR
jgi:hypothetical protein